jgi:hypothetical protein
MSSSSSSRRDDSKVPRSRLGRMFYESVHNTPTAEDLVHKALVSLMKGEIKQE